MKKLNKKGFTLIELLAVIVIMGILMIVAIPAVSRTINNSRKDTFIDTAKQYASAVKTAWISDGLNCRFYNGSVNDADHVPSAAYAGNYYVYIDNSTTRSNTVYSNDLLESGGKSPWGNKSVWGFVRITVTGTEATRKTKFSVYLTDGTHTVSDSNAISGSSPFSYNTKSYEELTRKHVQSGNPISSDNLYNYATTSTSSSYNNYNQYNRCYVN